MSWLSNTWDSVSGAAVDFYEGASAAVEVVMNDPGHAAAVFIDGFETGVADVGGLIIGGVPDLIDWGAERFFDVNLYDGSFSTAVSEGMMWAIDGAESLVGIEKPELRGDGDEFLFGAGRLTGQVTAGTLAIANAGALVSAARGTLSGAWTVASGTYKVASVASTATNVAIVGGVTAVGADMALNDGRITGQVTGAALNYGVRQATGYEDLGDAWRQVAPDWAQEMLAQFMEFMGQNPMLAKWGSFAATFFLGNTVIGAVAGDGAVAKIGGLAMAGLLAWGISEGFTNAAANTTPRDAAPDELDPSARAVVPAPVAAPAMA